MIVIRNTFRLKFGKAKEAAGLLKEGLAVQKKSGSISSYRLLTDLTGPFYRLVREITVPSLAVWETETPKNMADPEVLAAYQKFAALVESGHRDIYSVFNDVK